jgi:ketosteroid isomerase-like protein
MLTEESSNADVRVVGTMLDAIERGDMDEFRRCFAPSALIWHNFDEIEKNVDTVVAILSHICAVTTSRTYAERRVATVGSQAYLQHALIATFRSGRKVRLPAMMRVEVDSDGLVGRIEEYFDSRASAAVQRSAEGAA